MKSIFLLAAAAFLAAGCATTGGTLSDAAYRLDRSADALYQEVRRDGDQGLRRDAEEFADLASDFHRDVKDSEDRDDLRREFSRVAAQYHELRDEFGDARSSDSERRTAFAEVTRAYLDLERELEHKRVSGL